jgi:hypothetical protein
MPMTRTKCVEFMDPKCVWALTTHTLIGQLGRHEKRNAAVLSYRLQLRPAADSCNYRYRTYSTKVTNLWLIPYVITYVQLVISI